MRHFSVAIFSALLAGAAAAGVPVCPLGAGWTFAPEYGDEFNAPALDTNKWWDFNPDFYGRKPGYFARENVSLTNGCLRLLARNQNSAEVTVENRVRGYDLFTTATVKGKRPVLYGYFEARCQGMRSGVCNAFWLYDPLCGQPEKYLPGRYSEEIDIFELFGKPAKREFDRTLFQTVYRIKTPYVEGLVSSRQQSLRNNQHNIKVDFDFWADFHVYAFQWTPEVMVWYLDGREIFRRPNDHFKAPLRIMLDCEIMRAWSGDPDPADLPSVFLVDYLRVWRPAP